MIESVVARGHVVVSPAQLPRIGREDADVEAGTEGPREEGDGQFVVVGHVELVEARGVPVRFGDAFNRLAARGAEGVGEVELFGDFGDGELAEGVVDYVDADGGEADGGAYWRFVLLGQIELAGGFFRGILFVTFVAEDGGGGVS